MLDTSGDGGLDPLSSHRGRSLGADADETRQRWAQQIDPPPVLCWCGVAAVLVRGASWPVPRSGSRPICQRGNGSLGHLRGGRTTKTGSLWLPLLAPCLLEAVMDSFNKKKKRISISTGVTRTRGHHRFCTTVSPWRSSAACLAQNPSRHRLPTIGAGPQPAPAGLARMGSGFPWHPNPLL